MCKSKDSNWLHGNNVIKVKFKKNNLNKKIVSCLISTIYKLLKVSTGLKSKITM